MSQLLFLSLYCVGAFVAVYAAFAFARRPQSEALASDLKDDTLVFLLRDQQLVDTNFAARRVLERTTDQSGDMDRLRAFLTRHFPDPERLVAPPDEEGDLTNQSRDGQTQVIRQRSGESVRLRVSFISGPDPQASDIHTLRAIETELETLRANTSSAPFLLWRQNSDGDVTWVNQAYLDTARRVTDEIGSTWPLPVIFPSLGTLAAPKASESRRIAVQGESNEDEAWYDCHITSVGNDTLCTAIPADEAVRSENRRREFTQTLTKTFAELAIGLAIFDRSRRLVLFNPALLDLTSLPTDFLTSRPSLVGFLDRLRENRVMPEPRDYRSWRASIADLEAAAVDGTYGETWSLPDGQTYHVTGRPHPDGAVALLFEDISAEMALTRHFRTELEMSQSVFDTLEDAIAVFSPAGDLTLSNQAYRELWQVDPEKFLIGDLTEATRHWHDLATPTPIWGDFREFAQQGSDREEWTAKVSLRDGRRLSCRFAPQKGGATMAMFRVLASDPVADLQEAV